MELLDREGIAFVARWLHVIAGVCWIGLLWYFNLVQVPSFAQFNAPARNEAVEKLATRALWWFRWAALSTFVMGILITGLVEDYYEDFFTNPGGLSIFTGMVMGTIMAANVWMVIWPQQQTVIASAVRVNQGGEALPEATVAGRKAGLASRMNFIFSVPVIWFMVFTSHFAFNYGDGDISGGKAAVYLIISLAVIALLELNALGIIGGLDPAAKQPLNWPYETHRNAIISAFVLWAFFWLLWEIIF